MITNAPDPAIFHPPDEREPLDGRPLRVVAASWSDNPRKGTDVLQALGAAVDPSALRADLRRPRAGRRSPGWRVVGSAGLGGARSDSCAGMDCYVAASLDDPCSNALLEALACGLPALYRRSGGPPGARRRGRRRLRRPGRCRRRARPPRRRARRRGAAAIVVPALGEVADALPRGASGVSARRLVRAPLRRVRAGAVRLRTRDWPPFSRLFVLGDDASLGARRRGGVRHRGRAARRLPARASRLGGGARGGRSSSTRATSPRSTRWWTGSAHRLGLSYFHGRPGTPGLPGVRPRVRGAPARSRPASSASRSPTGRSRSSCSPPASTRAGCTASRSGSSSTPSRSVDPARREAARRAFGLPAQCVRRRLVPEGRVGFGDGLEPKSIKGPDVLVDALERVRARRPRPRRPPHRARPRVRPAGARATAASGSRPSDARRTRRARPGVPRARCLSSIASRQEGGPKSILESMATGVPLVTTRAGQAPDLVVGRRERAPRRRRGRRGPGRTGSHASTTTPRSSRGSARRVARTAERDVARARSRPRWEALLEGFAERADG